MRNTQSELFAVQSTAEEPRLPAGEYDGWTNSATYLAHLYIKNDQATYRRVNTLVDPACRIDPKKLAKLLPVTVLRDGDEEKRTGIVDGTLVLDVWAEGQIDWAAIADCWTLDERTELGRETVDDVVIQALATARIEGNVVLLTTGQLDRELYQKVDRTLKALGGRWVRKLGGHQFDEDPTDSLDNVIVTGRYAKPENFGFFPTPDELADFAVALADLRPGHRFLEPSAGTAALLSRAATIVGKENAVAIELQEKLYRKLIDEGYNALHGDFLSRHFAPDDHFDRIVMNPPFAKQADIDHVMKAWSILKASGKLVSIMAASVLFRENRKTAQFREMLDTHGHLLQNKQGAFKESGTAVNTVTVILNKP